MKTHSTGPKSGESCSRREALRRIGGSVALVVTGCRSVGSEDAGPGFPTNAGAAAPACVTRPRQTEGPYFIDEKLRRSDIRSDPADGSVRPGVPLRLKFQVSRLDRKGCRPLPGAVVDVWQCDALGIYSDVRDAGGRFDTTGRKFLRGFQVTDNGGAAEFLTIYPGWYPGRAVHIHFKIRTDGGPRGKEFTSQLYFDEALTDRIHARPPYNAKGKRDTTNDTDVIFRRGGDQLLLRPVEAASGYAATFEIGLTF